MFENPNLNNGIGGVQPMMGGYQYQGMPQPVPKFNNPLTPEQIKKLQQKSEQFSLGITEEEWLRGVCNHRNAEGTSDTLVYDQLTGEARCTICGYKFKPVDANKSPESIKDSVDDIVDILQTIKLMYIDLPPEAAKEYFQIIPLIMKIPQLFEFAAKNMTKHEAYNWQYNNKNMGTISMFNNLQTMLANGINPYMYQAPQASQMGAGFVPPQPQQMYGMSNGFGYPGAAPMPNPAYQATPGYAYNPNPQAAASPVTPTVSDTPAFVPGTAPAAPTTPAAGETKVTQNVNV